MRTRCTCGKNTKDPYKISCTSSKCPCNRQSQSCSRKCRCYNCKNENINAAKESQKPSSKIGNKGCTCGNTLKYNKGANQLSCRDGERKTKCPCVARREGCTNMCRCRNCSNIFQTGGISVTPLSERKRRRETVSSYSRKFGKKFLSAESAPLKSGPWRILETLCLIVCHEVLVVNGLPNNSINFASLYNFVAESNETKELSLPIASKTTAQIAAKMAHLVKHRT